MWDFYLPCCVLHDFGYRRGTDPITNECLTRRETDRRFRECIQQRSRFGKWNLLSWWRWIGVRLGTPLVLRLRGKRMWQGTDCKETE